MKFFHLFQQFHDSVSYWQGQFCKQNLNSLNIVYTYGEIVTTDLANLHSGHVGRNPAAIAYMVYIGKINENQIVVLSIYKHKKPASQFMTNLYMHIEWNAFCQW